MEAQHIEQVGEAIESALSRTRRTHGAKSSAELLEMTQGSGNHNMSIGETEYMPSPMAQGAGSPTQQMLDSEIEKANNLFRIFKVENEA